MPPEYTTLDNATMQCTLSLRGKSLTSLASFGREATPATEVDRLAQTQCTCRVVRRRDAPSSGGGFGVDANEQPPPVRATTPVAV